VGMDTDLLCEDVSRIDDYNSILERNKAARGNA